jgi:hypothetical protein
MAGGCRRAGGGHDSSGNNGPGARGRRRPGTLGSENIMGRRCRSERHDRRRGGGESGARRAGVSPTRAEQGPACGNGGANWGPRAKPRRLGGRERAGLCARGGARRWRAQGAAVTPPRRSPAVWCRAPRAPQAADACVRASMTAERAQSREGPTIQPLPRTPHAPRPPPTRAPPSASRRSLLRRGPVCAGACQCSPAAPASPKTGQRRRGEGPCRWLVAAAAGVGRAGALGAPACLKAAGQPRGGHDSPPATTRHCRWGAAPRSAHTGSAGRWGAAPSRALTLAAPPPSSPRLQAPAARPPPGAQDPAHRSRRVRGTEAHSAARAYCASAARPPPPPSTHPPGACAAARRRLARRPDHSRSPPLALGDAATYLSASHARRQGACIGYPPAAAALVGARLGGNRPPERAPPRGRTAPATNAHASCSGSRGGGAQARRPARWRRARARARQTRCGCRATASSAAATSSRRRRRTRARSRPRVTATAPRARCCTGGRGGGGGARPPTTGRPPARHPARPRTPAPRAPICVAAPRFWHGCPETSRP